MMVCFLLAALACELFGNWGLHAQFNPIPFFVWSIVGFASTVAVARAWLGKRLSRARMITVLALFGASLLVGVFALVRAANMVDPHVITRNRSYCAFHLREIGQGTTLYANAHGGRFPDSLLELAKDADADLGAEVFTCPETQPMGYLSRPTTQSILDDLESPTRSPFIYRGKGLTQGCDPHTVIAHDRLDNHGSDTGPRDVHVLLADGAVLDLPPSQAKALVRELDAGHNPPQEQK